VNIVGWVFAALLALVLATALVLVVGSVPDILRHHRIRWM